MTASAAIGTFAEAAEGSCVADVTMPAIGVAPGLADITVEDIDAAIELWLYAELADALGEAWDAGDLGPPIRGAVQTTVLLTPRRSTVLLTPGRDTTGLTPGRSSALLTPGRDTTSLVPARGTTIFIP